MKFYHKLMGSFDKRALFSFMRVLHIYLSCALFSLLLLFCISGVTLNHNNWLQGQAQAGTIETVLPDTLSEQLKTASAAQPTGLKQLSNWLSKHHNLNNARGITWQPDLDELELDYPLPAGYALVIVNLNSGELLIDYQTGSIWQLMNDLHKGRHTGTVWSWVIDISAVLISLFSLTGLIILWQLRAKRRLGLCLVIAGTLLPVVIYGAFVPQLHGL